MGGVVFPLKVIYLTLHASNSLITCAIMGLSATVCVFQVIYFVVGLCILDMIHVFIGFLRKVPSLASFTSCMFSYLTI